MAAPVDDEGESSLRMTSKSDPDGVLLVQAWQAWKMQRNPLLAFWGQWRLFQDVQLLKRHAEVAAHRQWQSRVLTRVLTGWTEYRQRREAAAALLRQWKEKRALECLNSPAPKPLPSFFVGRGSPYVLGPLGDKSTLAGLELLSVSMGALFEDLQATRGGDLVFEIQEQGNQAEAFEPLNSDRSQNVTLYANACIACQRVPYVAAAIRFASQQSPRPPSPSSKQAPAVTVCLPGEECSAGSVRAILQWAYTGSFTARDWVEIAEALRTGSYLGAREVVQLSRDWLIHVATRAGEELERLGRSLGVWRLWRTYGGKDRDSDGSRNGEGSWLRWRPGWADGDANRESVSGSGEGRLLEAGNEGAESNGARSRNENLRSDTPAEVQQAADFVAGSLAALSSCGVEDESVMSFLANACPVLENVLLLLLQLDLRVESSTLGLLLDRLDKLRGAAGESTDARDDKLITDDSIDAGVFALFHRWWAIDPPARFCSARALLDEHVSLGALSVARLESLVARCQEVNVRAEASHTVGLFRLEEVRAAYTFALRVDNEYGKSRCVMRQSIGRWKWREKSRAWQSWQEFCRDGLGTSRLLLAKRAMRVWSLRSVVRLFEGWRQATVEGKIEERQRLASWKWKRACQNLLKAKQDMAMG